MSPQRMDETEVCEDFLDYLKLWGCWHNHWQKVNVLSCVSTAVFWRDHVKKHCSVLRLVSVWTIEKDMLTFTARHVSLCPLLFSRSCVSAFPCALAVVNLCASTRTLMQNQCTCMSSELSRPGSVLGYYSSSYPSSLFQQIIFATHLLFSSSVRLRWERGVHGESCKWLRNCAPAGFVSLQVQ